MTEPTLRCVKCGSTDISTTFHEATECSYEYCDDCHESHGCKGGQDEHLVRFCRVCRFEWYDSPLDAAVKT